MRVLIVGAGIAGLSLAGLLRRFGVEPCVVEKTSADAPGGYALGLWPLGSRVLHGLGLYKQFVAASRAFHSYRILNGNCREIKTYSLDTIAQRFGHLGMLERKELLDLLYAGAGTPVRHGVSVEAITSVGEAVRVVLTDGSDREYDLVVGTDGIHSKVRELLFGPQPFYDVKWGFWGWWDPGLTLDGADITEIWDAGRFLGVYPARNRTCVFAGGPMRLFSPEVVHSSSELLALFPEAAARLPRIFESLPKDRKDAYFWRMRDVRSPAWVKGRVVLAGDAAAAFLPTAGIGASMALESAAVLADELSRADAASIPLALDLYQKRERARVERIQEDSRKLARLAFVRSSWKTALRNRLLRFYTIEMFSKNIARSLQEPN
ncbi:MAG TPA: NAD(P)/FAD-dependent oxidoreductase [Bryobacteraceae bacterium]|nr:NAD(P)/FAD-dependent oxidoreductase [Bryobacteraceae bacterium]